MKERMDITHAIREAQKSGARLKLAAETAGISLRTFERWEKDPSDDHRKDNRFAVTNALTKRERRVIRKTICHPEYMDLNPHQIVAILAEKGRYIGSESTIYRFMRKEGLRVHRGRSRTPERSRPDEFVATAPNQIWTWDISYIASDERGVHYYLYLIVDIWDRCIVGWCIHKRESGKLAARFLRRTCLRHHIPPKSLVVHQDNGKPMTSSAFLTCLAYWGKPSYSRPGVSDDNPYSESLFKHLKYNHRYPVRFEAMQAAKDWMTWFEEYYNHSHRHSAIGFVTPAQRRTGQAEAVLSKRRLTYADARSKHPERWSRNTRSWEAPEKVALNPRSKKSARQMTAKS